MFEELSDLAITIARAESRLIVTDYPYIPHSRNLASGPGGRQLTARFEQEEASYLAQLEALATCTRPLLSVGATATEPGVPFWLNDWFPALDAVVLYGLVAQRAPRRYIEVGSGMSTCFVRQAIRDWGHDTRIVSIDPHPRAEIDAVCDEIARCTMEDMPPDFWQTIGAGDILFVDNSHRSFPNSDVSVFFCDVLPALDPGALWGLHDIFLPWDYPEAWSARFYNEQYLLLAYLLGGGGEDDVLLPLQWLGSRLPVRDILAPLWSYLNAIRGVQTGGGGFWMQRRCTGTPARE